MPSPCHPVWWLGVMQHQLPHLWHCSTFSRVHVLPGTLSSPPDCLANSRWQPAWLPEVAPLQLISLLGYLQPFGSTPDLSYFCTGFSSFQEGAQGGFPCGGRGQDQPLRPMVMVQWQLALTEAMACRLESREQS